MWWDARSDHLGSGPQTNETAGCSGAAPIATAQSESRRTPAATRPAATAQVEPRADLLRRRAHRRWGSIDQGPDPPASGYAAADGPLGSAPQSTRWKTGSRCAPADLASQLGSWPIFAETTGFFSKLLMLDRGAPDHSRQVASSRVWSW